jgi:murein DD-endopeptidase MepM/ murein hydrolase activator NlpD
LFAASVEELLWPKGESFLTFLEKQSIPIKLYYDLDKEDQELCSEIQTNNRYYLYTNDDGTLNQVLIPISEDIQLHIYKDEENSYKFQTLPINYSEYTQTVAIQINESISQDIQKATGDVTLAIILKSLFSSVDLRNIKKGDFVALEYSQKSYLGKQFGMPDIKAAMVQINGKPFYRFKNEKDEKYYDEKGVGFTKTYLFQMPVSYQRISSDFTKKRFHPVLKRYRAHLGTDFAAPAGRNIYAASEGRVEFVGAKGGYGKTIIINHNNGYKTVYAHQSKFGRVKQGMSVKGGQHIGYVGSTGLSSGPHLHFGIYKNGVAINPMGILKKPKIEGLNGKDKTTFIANSKITIDTFDKEVKDENRTIPIRLDRLTDRSEINIF